MPDCDRCGHPFEVHCHYRDGTDCGICVDCRSYRTPPGRFRRWVERLLR